MMALYHRDVHGAAGQLVDVSLIEPLARLVEQSTLAYDQLGVVETRTGNRADASAPRNVYRTSDDRWIALSSASDSTAARVYRAIERPDLATRSEYVGHVARQERAAEIDDLVSAWVGGHTLDHVMAVFLDAGVAAAPVYDARQLLADEHLRARGTFVVVDDPELGAVTVQAPIAMLSETPGRITHLGPRLGADNDAVYRGLLGMDAGRLSALRAAGTI
jgi:crotonobetainyl-CoA:carnitine CoA-transferase CaiB-like acyl-CoA transferase